MKTKTITFADLSRFLLGLGYAVKSTGKAHVFHKKHKDLLIFRRYRDNERVDEHDLSTTRFFLDSWGLLAAEDFDAYLERAATPA